MVAATIEVHPFLQTYAFSLTHFNVRDDVVAHQSSWRVSLYFLLRAMQDFLHEKRIDLRRDSLRQAAALLVAVVAGFFVVVLRELFVGRDAFDSDQAR